MRDFFGWAACLLVSMFVSGVTADFLNDQATFKPAWLGHQIDSNTSAGNTT